MHPIVLQNQQAKFIKLEADLLPVYISAKHHFVVVLSIVLDITIVLWYW
jgi:hypothetical protein